MGSFGERLQREREMRGITLEEIADSTKIGTRSLRALEQEDFDKLPGGIFNKGFVRAYARYLGIDEEQAVADFLAAAGEAEQPLPSPKPTEKQVAYRSGSRGWAVVLALAVLAAGGSAAWRMGWGPFAGHASPPVQTPPVVQAPAPSTSATSVAAAPAGEASTQPSAAAGSEAASGPAGQPASEEGFVVVLRAREDTWLSLTADGQPVMEGVLAAAATREVRAKDSVVLKLGNAAGVEVSHNGTALPVLGRPGEVRTVTFTPQGPQP
jgi:cytoskeleton protein RodZ